MSAEMINAKNNKLKTFYFWDVCNSLKATIEICFILSELNQSDLFSRAVGKGTKSPAKATNPFYHMVVRNADGVILKPEQLFSEEKRLELNAFFGGNG